MHMVKKYKIQVWGGPHNVEKRLSMRLDAHQIEFSPKEYIHWDLLSPIQKRTLLKHLCGDKSCCKEIRNAQWCYEAY